MTDPRLEQGTDVQIALWIGVVVTAMLLPFLPGRHDPVAASLSISATAAVFGGLLLVPIGMAWLISRREYAVARIAVGAAALVACAAAVAAAASGSLAAAVLVLAASALRLAHLWRRVGAAQASRAGLPRLVPIGLIVVPLISAGARLTVVEAAAAWSRDRAIANSTALVSDIERYRARTGAYPAAISSVWPDYHPGIVGVERYRYEPSGPTYNLYFEHPATDIAAREIVMYNPLGEQDISSHAFDLLRLSPEEIARQRGYFAVYDLPQANWRRFLFD
jgi:hypothetical protein